MANMVQDRGARRRGYLEFAGASYTTHQSAAPARPGAVHFGLPCCPCNPQYHPTPLSHSWSPPMMGWSLRTRLRLVQNIISRFFALACQVQIKHIATLPSMPPSATPTGARLWLCCKTRLTDTSASLAVPHPRRPSRTLRLSLCRGAIQSSPPKEAARRDHSRLDEAAGQSANEP